MTNTLFAAFLNSYGSVNVQSGEFSGEKMVDPYRWGVEEENGIWRPAKGYENHPIVYVTWFGAHTFTQWLGQKTGRRYRLPTEAEWEFAARGGNGSQGYKYSGGDEIEAVAWYDE